MNLAVYKTALAADCPILTIVTINHGISLLLIVSKALRRSQQLTGFSDLLMKIEICVFTILQRKLKILSLG